MHLFRALLDEARSVADPAARAQRLGIALRLWRGPALADAAPDELRLRLCGGLEEARLAAIEERIDADLDLGRHQALLDELRGLVAEYPNRPRLVRQLALALYRSGRANDALDACRAAGRRLADEWGLDPDPELTQLGLDILRASPALDLPSGGVATVDPRPTHQGAAPPPIPAQLPADVPDFTGRAAELHWLSRPAAVRLVTGMPGAGKTALAVHWAHRVAHRFPDGQLYLDLRGYSSDPPVSAPAALAHVLRSLGVQPDQVPADAAEAAARYRSLLAGRRVLILLDNAADAEQVRPLLPGAPGCVALVTSRGRLARLTAQDGAQRLELGGLAPSDAARLATRIARLLAAPIAAELARLCGYLPLALRIGAANLDGDRRDPATYLKELRDGQPLAALSVDGQRAVAVAFDLSYTRLSVHSRQMFRLLGLVPGPDISLAAVAALTDLPPPGAGDRLDELVAAHLVQRGAPDRYRLHDLLRRYARDRALADEDPTTRRLARKRLFGWYLSHTDAAAALLYPNMLRLPTRGRPPGAGRMGRPGRSALFTDSARALAWLDSERPNLTAAVLDPAEAPWPSATVELADALRGYLHQGRHTSEAALVGRAALARARTPAATATARLTLALAYSHLGRNRMAVRECRAAVCAAQQANWPDGEAAALTNLGNLYWRAGSMRPAANRYRRALCIYRRTGWPAGLSTTQANLAMTYRALGRLDDALECATQALAAYQQSGSAGGEAIALDNLGTLHRERGDLASSFAALRRALGLFQAVGNRYGEALALTSLALAHRDAGAYPEAAATAHRGLLLARRVGDGRAEADALIACGSVALAAGDQLGAVDRYTEALNLARRIDNRYPQAEALVGLAAAHAAAGAQQLARACAEQAMTSARHGGYRPLERDASAILSRRS